MKVILLADVQRVGHEGDILDVADGYVRNYLEPRGLAVKASKGAIRDLENRRAAIERREVDKRAQAEELAAGLREMKIVVHAPVGEGTRLHGSVTSQQVAIAAAEQLKFDIDRRDVDIAEPIRELGDYLVSARVYKDVTAQLAVSVVPLASDDDDEAEAVGDEPTDEVTEDEEAVEEDEVVEEDEPVEDEEAAEEDEE